MELSHKEQITEAISVWIASSANRSGNKLAELAGVSAAHISKIKGGAYEMPVGSGKISPISDEVFNKLGAALGLRFSSALHWNTENYKTVHNVCRSAQNKHLRILLESDTGLGKTYALERYALENDKVLYIKVTRTMGAKDMLDEIIHKLGIKEQLRGNRNKMVAINKKVTSIEGFLIIVDEGEYLKNALYDLIKEIADFTDRRCGMIFSGCGLVAKIETMAGRNRPGFPQLKRRFFPNKVELKEMQKKDIKTICRSEEIEDTTAVNVIARYVFDFDMLAQMIQTIKEVQQREKRALTGQDVIDLFHLNY